MQKYFKKKLVNPVNLVSLIQELDNYMLVTAVERREVEGVELILVKYNKGTQENIIFLPNPYSDEVDKLLIFKDSLKDEQKKLEVDVKIQEYLQSNLQ
jgi:hypothetical protein